MSSSVSRDHLRSFVERIERLEEEKKSISDDIRDVYAEAKANGYDAKTLRKVVSLRKLDSMEREEQEALLDLYMNALGMNAPTDDSDDSSSASPSPTKQTESTPTTATTE